MIIDILEETDKLSPRVILLLQYWIMIEQGLENVPRIIIVLRVG